MVTEMEDIRAFGLRLIETEDLDPVYSAVYRAQLREPQLCRWLSAYLMFYHVGVASYLSEREGSDFWDACAVAAVNEVPAPIGGRWPRSSERRHFRGVNCVNAVHKMRERSPQPEELWRGLQGLARETQVIAHVKARWPMHGDWAGFKVADLAERVSRYPIKFDRNLGLLYESPRKAIDVLVAATGVTAEQVYGQLMGWVDQYAAPPTFDRPCGPQELETILCKWGSKQGGHYHVGKDNHEVRKALRSWAQVSPTAGYMLRVAPALVS